MGRAPVGCLLGHAGVERALLLSAGWAVVGSGGLWGDVSDVSSSEHPGTLGQGAESVGSPWVSQAWWVRTRETLGGAVVGTWVLTHARGGQALIRECGWDELAGAVHTRAAQTERADAPGGVLDMQLRLPGLGAVAPPCSPGGPGGAHAAGQALGTTHRAAKSLGPCVRTGDSPLTGPAGVSLHHPIMSPKKVGEEASTG